MANRIIVDNEGFSQLRFLLILRLRSWSCVDSFLSCLFRLLTYQFMFRFYTSWTITVMRCCPWAPWWRCPRTRSASSSAETPSRRTSSSSSKSVQCRPAGDVWRGLDSSYSIWQKQLRRRLNSLAKNRWIAITDVYMTFEHIISSVIWLMVF